MFYSTKQAFQKLTRLPGNVFYKRKNMKNIGREKQWYVFINLFMCLVWPKNCVDLHPTQLLYIAVANLRDTEGTLLLTKCNSEHNDDYYSISYALLWTTF